MNNNQNGANVDPNAVNMQTNQANPMNNQMNLNQNQQSFQTNPYINNMQNGLNQNPYIANQNMQNPGVNDNTAGGFNTNDFVKGALIGAGVAFLLTNKTTQQAIFNGFSKGSELVQAGIEEMKERIEDAKAQMEAKEF